MDVVHEEVEIKHPDEENSCKKKNVYYSLRPAAMSKLPAPDGRTQVAPGSRNLLQGRNPKAKNRRKHS